MSIPTEWIQLSGFVGNNLEPYQVRSGAVLCFPNEEDFGISDGKEWHCVSEGDGPIGTLYDAIKSMWINWAVGEKNAYHEPQLGNLYVKFFGDGIYSWTSDNTVTHSNTPKTYKKQPKERYLSLSMYGIF